jgi:hypothetical protein
VVCAWRKKKWQQKRSHLFGIISRLCWVSPCVDSEGQSWTVSGAAFGRGLCVRTARGSGPVL